MLLVSDSRLDSFAQFMTVLVLFVVVIVITYITTKYVAGVQRFRFKGKNIEVIEAQRIAQNICVYIIRIGEHYYAVTVGRDSVTCLCELSKDEINLPEEVQMAPAGFKYILDKTRRKDREK